MLPKNPDFQGEEASKEFFYLRVDGTKGDDWIHEEILNNPEAEEHFRESAIRRAVRRGMSRELAMKLFG